MKYFLIILTFLPLFAQSQDTIKIPAPVAKQIVKDLVSGDSAKAELNLVNSQVHLLEQKITLKDSIIIGREKQLVLCDERLANEVKKFDSQALWVKQLQKENKKLKIKLRFIQITGTAIIGGLTYLYITK
jgi:hypothetical protein